MDVSLTLLPGREKTHTILLLSEDQIKAFKKIGKIIRKSDLSDLLMVAHLPLPETDRPLEDMKSPFIQRQIENLTNEVMAMTLTERKATSATNRITKHYSRILNPETGNWLVVVSNHDMYSLGLIIKRRLELINLIHDLMPERIKFVDEYFTEMVNNVRVGVKQTDLYNLAITDVDDFEHQKDPVKSATHAADTAVNQMAKQLFEVLLPSNWGDVFVEFKYLYKFKKHLRQVESILTQFEKQKLDSPAEEAESDNK